MSFWYNFTYWLRSNIHLKHQRDCFYFFGLKIYKKVGFSINLIYDEEEGYSLNLIPIFFSFWIPIPFLPKPKDKDLDYATWGFTFTNEALHTCWGSDASNVYFYPWDMTLYRKEIKDQAGSWTLYWMHGGKDWPSEEEIRDKFWVYKPTVPFELTLKSGVVQSTFVTLHIKRFSFKPKCFLWCPLWPEVKRVSAELVFEDEVGRDVDSYKGGVIAMSAHFDEKLTIGDNLNRVKERLI